MIDGTRTTGFMRVPNEPIKVPSPKEKTEAMGRRDQAGRVLILLVKEEREKGSPRPSRRAIETKLRRDSGLTQEQVDVAFVDFYNHLVVLGVLRAI